MTPHHNADGTAGRNTERCDLLSRNYVNYVINLADQEINQNQPTIIFFVCPSRVRKFCLVQFHHVVLCPPTLLLPIK